MSGLITPHGMNSPQNPELGRGESHNGRMDLALAWDVLKELGNSERHFNNLEAEYRKLASIWLLAGFAGMGFILKENPQMAVPREIALVAIGLAASIGIYVSTASEIIWKNVPGLKKNFEAESPSRAATGTT